MPGIMSEGSASSPIPLTQLIDTAPDGNQWLTNSNLTATGCQRGSTVVQSSC
jgi:hypothetical protein